ncbi:hypothetical protein [Ensifer sp. WSM1721]|uniref:hypothetical protein n=1 Tax=Ensifer sp. WSM1721 TaxID=1041159 RepID=UPI0004B7EEEC|nr:hypothetical protein [Ensifer sp. WSM1721]
MHSVSGASAFIAITVAGVRATVAFAARLSVARATEIGSNWRTDPLCEDDRSCIVLMNVRQAGDAERRGRHGSGEHRCEK